MRTVRRRNLARPNRIWALALLGVVAWLLAACATAPRDGADASSTLTVFAASSLTDAFTELAETVESQNPGVAVQLNFAGSSQLAAQLSEGVTADVFASANSAQMQAVVEAQRVEANAVQPFASNRLTVIVPADNPAGIETFVDLAQPGTQVILAAEGVPVRDYTDKLLAAQPAAFQTQFYANLVSAEANVRQVVAKIALGEADAGVVYTSDVTSDIAGRVQQIAIPNTQNVIATYPIAPLVDAPQPALAQRFIDFVLSEDGQAILSRRGFGPPSAP